jgi:soluble lytic murein transglycosylase-like protein
MIKALIVSALIITPVSANVYIESDNSGRLFITSDPIVLPNNSPTIKIIQPIIKASTKPKIKPKVLTAQEINSYIHKASLKYNVDEKLIHAVIKTESTYRTKAVSKKGAVGLMQLMPATATRFGVSDRADAKQNIDGGVKFLKFLLDTFKDTKLAIAGYNAGEHAVMRHNNSIPPYPETKNYVGLVMAAYNE